MGEHQASPPPPYWGYSPACTICEKRGTSRTTPRATPGREVVTRSTAGRSDTMAPTVPTVGVSVVPALRSSVTRSCQEAKPL